jgi:hypothetical protein
VTALATLQRADKPLLDAAARQLASKAAGAESAQDVGGALWGFASLGYAPDGGALAKASAAIKAGG